MFLILFFNFVEFVFSLQVLTQVRVDLENQLDPQAKATGSTRLHPSIRMRGSDVKPFVEHNFKLHFQIKVSKLDLNNKTIDFACISYIFVCTFCVIQNDDYHALGSGSDEDNSDENDSLQVHYIIKILTPNEIEKV